jgi:hypothetical protein
MPIKFSHTYEKIKRMVVESHRDVYNEIPKEAHLISVAAFDLSQLPEEFVHWDTLYYENGEEKHYQLEPGRYIVLIFFDQDRLFSTLRPCTERKLAYYLSMIGRKFDVVITDA